MSKIWHLWWIHENQVCLAFPSLLPTWFGVCAPMHIELWHQCPIKFKFFSHFLYQAPISLKLRFLRTIDWCLSKSNLRLLSSSLLCIGWSLSSPPQWMGNHWVILLDLSNLVVHSLRWCQMLLLNLLVILLLSALNQSIWRILSYLQIGVWDQHSCFEIASARRGIWLPTPIPNCQNCSLVDTKTHGLCWGGTIHSYSIAKSRGVFSLTSWFLINWMIEQDCMSMIGT